MNSISTQINVDLSYQDYFILIHEAKFVTVLSVSRVLMCRAHLVCWSWVTYLVALGDRVWATPPITPTDWYCTGGA